METTYDKQRVDRIFRMIDKDGFVELFNQTLKTACRNNQKLTKNDAFNKLNDEYYQYTGKYRYNCYESFKIVLYHK